MRANNRLTNKQKRIAKDDDTINTIKELALEASYAGKINKPSSNTIGSLNTASLNATSLDHVVNNIDDSIDDELLSDSNESIDRKNIKNTQVACNQISNEFKEKVLTYVKCDNMIRKKMEEIKSLKQTKKPCEDYIIEYLEKKNAPHVSYQDVMLIKNESESKGSLKMELIKDAIIEGITGEEISSDAVKSDDLATKIMNIMESKRIKTTRVNLKRKVERKVQRKVQRKVEPN